MTPAKALTGLGGVAVIVAAAAWAFWPRPLLVDLATVQVAPMQLTVAADGVTRVRDPYEVTAPITGNLQRMQVAVGDPVTQGDVIAVIEPAAAAILDARARLQAEADVAEARAALEVAEASLVQAQADLTHAEAELTRASALAARGVVAPRLLEDAQIMRDGAQAAARVAQSRVALQQAALARAQAALVVPGAPDTPAPDTPAPDRRCCVEVLAPQTGTVLAITNPSARFVGPGAPLMTIGDLSRMEVEVDLLSTDAVRVTPGAAATLERWGGDGVIPAVVRRVEPAGFTRVSALGIEEQRVRVQLDILDPALGVGLGDNFRVFVRIVIWQDNAVLQLPIGALFRSDAQWAVFQALDGRAALTPVEIGRMSDLSAQVLSGVPVGAQIILFPGNKITDGTRIADRAAP